MRIISGSLKGRKITETCREHKKITTDFLREAVFNIIGDKITGAVFLDLFAGSGLVGLEALSRGAAFASFIELDRQRFFSLKKNLEKLLPPDGYSLHYGNSLKKMGGLKKKYNFVYLDPPYFDNIYSRTFSLLEQKGILCPAAEIIVERHIKTGINEIPEHFVQTNERRYGQTIMEFFSYCPAMAAPAD